jgi:hypothetical protein
MKTEHVGLNSVAIESSHPKSSRCDSMEIVIINASLLSTGCLQSTDHRYRYFDIYATDPYPQQQRGFIFDDLSSSLAR